MNATVKIYVAELIEKLSMILYCRLGFCYMHCSGLLKCGTNGIQFGCLGQSRREQSTFFSASLYHCSLPLLPNLTLQKMVSTCVQSQWNSGENSLFFYPWRFTLKFPLHHLNWIWWIEKLWTIFHLCLSCVSVWFCLNWT